VSQLPEPRRDRPYHLPIYVIAGAAMGGFLDTAAFGERTPLWGMLFGALVALLYWFIVCSRTFKRR